jgi:hypothetical protein
MSKELPPKLAGLNENNISKLLETELTELQNRQETHKLTWEDLTPDRFPAYYYENPVEIGMLRFSLITSELEAVGKIGPIVAIKENSLDILRGRIKQLREAAADTILLIYPDVEPVHEKPNQIDLDRDALAFLGWIEDNGLVQFLNKEIVPTIEYLTPDQLLLKQLQTLASYFKAWGEIKNSPTDDALGFNRKDKTPSIEEIAQIIQNQITITMEDLAAKGSPFIQKWFSKHHLVQES